MLPSIWNGNNSLSLFDDFFEWPFGLNNAEKKLFGGSFNRLMKTDVSEKEDCYEMSIDLPGFTKDDVNVQLKDGYLIVNAEKHEDNSEKDDAGKLIRQERYMGAMTRSFYVGDVTEDDVKAKFENGVLQMTVPKKKEELPEKKFIAIE